MYCATLLLVIYSQSSCSSWSIVYFIYVVLFSGDIVFEDSNIEFESTRFDWNYAYRGTSLCLGHLHPDIVILEEKHLKSEKKAYYSELHDYHYEYVKCSEIYL